MKSWVLAAAAILLFVVLRADLVRVQSPYPDPFAGTDELRTERFHYDGIRRIQEVLTDPLLDTDGAADGGESAAMSALLEEPQLDGSAVTLGSESNQTEAATPAPPAQNLEREYIWGPGDNGIDELLVQFDRQRDAWWVVQDAGVDAIAVCDLGGAGGAARVVWQGTYDAYGAVLSAESLHAHAYTRIGHKGLFFDRLDGGVVEQYTLAETPRLAAGARLAGHVRNRTLLPDLGRFAQQDPNATGAMLLASAYAGSGLGANVSAFDLQSLYGNGGNLYEYVGSNAWTNSDPLGLFYGYYALDLGFSIGKTLYELTDTYADNMDFDSDWASDWSMADDWYTRGDSSWVGEILASNFQEYVEGVLWAEPFQLGGAGGTFIKAIKIAGKVVRKGRLHHAWPKYLGRITGKQSPVLAKLPHKHHVSYHNHVSHGMKNDLGCPHMNASRKDWDKWLKEEEIKGFTEAQSFQRLESSLMKHTRTFEKNHSVTGLVDALKEALR